MARPNRLLLLIPSIDLGGAQRAMCSLSEQLADHYKVYLAVFNTQYRPVYDHGGELINLDVAGGGSPPQKIFHFLQRIWRLNRVLKEHQIDTVLSFLEGADYVNLLSRARCRIISIRGAKLQDRDIHGFMRTVRLRFLIPLLYRRASRIVCVSERLAHDMRTAFSLAGDNVSTIYNAYDAASIQAIAAEPLAPEHQCLFDRPVVIMSGRLHPGKGHKRLLNVFRRLRQKLRARLLIMGDGDIKAEVVAHARGLEMIVDEGSDPSADVNFLGFHANVYKFVSRADVFVFPSDYEGFGNALAEALVLGTTSLASDCVAGPREILAPGTDYMHQTKRRDETPYGMLLPVMRSDDDEHEWLDALYDVLTDPDKRERMARHARERIALLDPALIAAQWVALIDGARAKSTRQPPIKKVSP